MRLLSALILSAALPPACAAGLVDTWRDAQAHDPMYAAARAAHDVAPALRDEARAVWRPSVALEGAASEGALATAVRGARFSAPGFGTSDGVSFDTSVSHGTDTHYALALQQPLYDRGLDARASELHSQAALTDNAWFQARQQLMLKTASAYLDAAVARRRLLLLEREQVAVDRAWQEARDRFAAGDRPSTDVHEATARSRALTAERLAAQADVRMRAAALTALTGHAPDLASLQLPVASSRALEDATRAGDLDDWLARAAAHSPDVLAAGFETEIAGAQAQAVAGALSPSASLVAQVGRDRLAGDGAYGSASSTARDAGIGLKLSVPLYTGGLRSAQSQAAQARLAASSSQWEVAREQVRQQVRELWLALSVASDRLAALAAQVDATRERLDATQTGLQAGERTTQDLLNAQNDLGGAELALAEAGAQVVRQRLALAALAGELDDAALARADAWLAGR